MERPSRGGRGRCPARGSRLLPSDRRSSAGRAGLSKLAQCTGSAPAGIGPSGHGEESGIERHDAWVPHGFRQGLMQQLVAEEAVDVGAQPQGPRVEAQVLQKARQGFCPRVEVQYGKPIPVVEANELRVVRAPELKRVAWVEVVGTTARP